MVVCMYVGVAVMPSSQVQKVRNSSAPSSPDLPVFAAMRPAGTEWTTRTVGGARFRIRGEADREKGARGERGIDAGNWEKRF
jgi:hypothetical protein